MNHNYYTIQFKKLDKYLILHPELKRELNKASLEYVNEKHYSSYRKIGLKYPNISLSMFGIMVKKIKLKKGLSLPCLFCDKGSFKKSFCRFCLGNGLIDKDNFKQFNCVCKENLK